MKIRNQERDYIKACRRQAREEEIEMYGKSIKFSKVRQSKKAYNRKQYKHKFDNE